MANKKAQYTVNNGVDYDVFHFETSEDMIINAAQDLSINGYRKLPGGFILQWGNVVATANNGTILQNVNYPISFPNVILGTTAVVSSVAYEPGNASRYNSGHGIKTTSQGSISASNINGDTGDHVVSINWTAIGY